MFMQRPTPPPKSEEFDKWVAALELELGRLFNADEMFLLRRAWTAATAVAVEKIRDVIRHPYP